ncbi:hypothetical protein AB0M19_15065 [Streptomyces sp. NPDC051920]|uniref:hypothetical protein n=1 Tax=Streptomyces sp. NPDC051920 TaxID=3155523 RepID=UPI003422F39F
MKPEQDPERTPSRETAAAKGRGGTGPDEPREAPVKGRVTPVPAERSPDDRAGGEHGEAEEVSRREALKGRVDHASTEPAPGGSDDLDRNGDRATDGPGSTARLAGSGTADDAGGRPAGTGRTARTTTGAGTEERGGAPGDGRAERTGVGSASPVSPVAPVSPVSPVSRPSGASDGSGPGPVSRDAAEADHRGGPADTEDCAGDSAGRDGGMLPLDEHDKFKLRMRHAVGGFIDGPQASVEEADHVLEELAGRFTEAVTRRRRDLRTAWQAGDEDKAAGPDTERLRLALKDYREMTERLLSL